MAIKGVCLKMTIIHVVQKEESITDISKKFAIDKNTIMSINRIHDDNSIVPGQSILIPINDNKYTYCEKCKTIEVNAFINAPYDTMKSTLILTNQIVV